MLDELYSHLGYKAVGTIRDNRSPKNYPLEDKKKFAKSERAVKSVHTREK